MAKRTFSNQVCRQIAARRRIAHMVLRQEKDQILQQKQWSFTPETSKNKPVDQ